MSRVRPQIVATDQSSQLTSRVWVEELTKVGVSISMYGRGRVPDNTFVERP